MMALIDKNTERSQMNKRENPAPAKVAMWQVAGGVRKVLWLSTFSLHWCTTRRDCKVTMER